MSLTQLLFGFDGRIRRTNYWLGALGAGFVSTLVIGVVMVIAGGGAMMAGGHGAALAGMGLMGAILGLVWFVFVLWVSLALQVKRWHDRDKPWPWVFLSFIPLIGGLWVLVECGFLDGTPGPNRYGPSPKGLTGTEPAPAPGPIVAS